MEKARKVTTTSSFRTNSEGIANAWLKSTKGPDGGHNPALFLANDLLLTNVSLRTF
jgi:hypothetical protein